MSPRPYRTWQALLRRAGLPGVAALALMPATAAIAWWLPQLKRQNDDLRVQVAATAAAPRTQPRPRAASDGEQLKQLVAQFPPLGQSADDVARVFSLARARNVNLSRGDYQLKSDPNAALVTYAVTFPVRNEYGALKAFTADVLEALPHVSMDEMRMSRTDATTGALDSTVRFTFVYRSP